MKIANMSQVSSEKLYYDKKYLNDQCDSKGFLSSISYTVQLNDLLQLRKSCVYHENMRYVPVIFEIMVQRLKDYYRGNFFLQVWDDTGVKVYEKVLKYDIISWNIFHNYLVYKTDKKEEGGSQIIVVDFRKDFKEIRVKNFIGDKTFVHVGVNQGLLYYANHKDIKIVDIEVNFGDKAYIEIDPTPELIGSYEIKSGCKLHGFFENGFSKDDQYIMCMVETFDNQIDFTRLYNWSRDVKAPEIAFYQYREVVQRERVHDPIVKISQVIMKNEFQFGVVLRQSGKVDLYWNFTLTQTPEGKINEINKFIVEIFTDVSSNFTSLFLKSEKNGVAMMHQIDIKWDSRIGIDVAQDLQFKEDIWFKIQNTQLKYSVKPFQATTLINTTFLIAYNNVVSSFDIIKKLWIDHYIMDEPVVDVLRNQIDQESDDYVVGMLLKSGKIFELETKKINGEMVWSLKGAVAHNIGTGIKKIVSDWRDVASHYIYLENGNGPKIIGYQNCTVRDMTQDLKDKSNDEYMIRFISTDPTEDIAMYNPNQGVLKVYCNKSHYSECQLTFQKEYKISDSDYYKIQNTKIHTITEPVTKDYLFLFDTKSVFIYNKAEKTLTEVKDMNITNLQLIDGVYIYALTNDIPSKKLYSGFYFYDLNQLAEKADESFNFKLKGAIVGVNSLVDYYRLDERIAYMQDYDSVKIVPLLHRNCINMIGMQKRKNYVCFLKKKDKFIALDKNNTLTTWNVTTGKVIGQYKLKVQVVPENYEIYRCGSDDITYHADWYQPIVLLIDPQTQVTDVDEKGFYGDRLYSSLPNNTTYTAVEQKEWRNFKIIKIVSETEVREVCSFVHPFYGLGNYQRIYFSDDYQYMLERLVNQRAFIFKREDLATAGMSRWRFVRRLKQFPMDLAESTFANYLFSPDLQFYLDYDQSDDQFLIKRTLDQSTYCQIPKGIMNPSSEDPKRLSKRFCWVNSQQIKVINNEGIEKFIEIKNGQFKDINQDTIPMINLKDFDTEKFQYYFQPTSFTLDQTEERLIRKFQKFNSAVCLEQITDKELLYDTIFEVDYSLKNFTGKVVIDTSFTFIHWKLAEMLAKNPKIKLKKFSLSDLTKTALNVFPKGNTVMHYSYKQLNNIRKMFDVVNHYNSTLKEDGVLLEIPFVQNFKGMSPLHQCVNDKNYKSAEIFLQKLAETGLDSHARAIVDILPQLVSAGVPSLGTYLDKRLIQTKQLKERGQKRGALIYTQDLDYAVNTCELWPDMQQVDKMLFSNDPRDAEIKLEFLDMPKIHSYQEKIGDEFFAALAESDDISVFQYKSIQALIDYKWPLAREYTIKILFIPFLMYHLTFLVYSNVFCGQYEFEEDKYYGSMWIGHNVLAALLYLFSIYFLSNETRQLFLGGLDYFKSVWNYTDLLPPILISITVSLKLNTFYNENYEPNNIVYTIHSVATLLMWVKLLYFLRIFKSTGYLVRTLTDVIYDMKVFLLILFIVYFGFGEAFLRLSEKSGEAMFIKNYAMSWVYSFRLSVGDNATDTFDDSIQPTTVWILFVIAGILTNIVMLNLLISIISDSFAQINEKSKEANYQERARIISENGYLIPRYIKDQQDDFDKYIILASEVVDSADDDKNAIQNKAKSIEESLVAFKEEYIKRQNDLDAKIEELLQQK